MDERLIKMLQGAKDVESRVREMEGVTHTPTANESGEKALPMYNNVDGTQLLESVPNSAQHNGMQVAHPIGAGGPDEYALRPVQNTAPIQQTFKNLHTSKMSPEILKLMVDNPIQQVGPKLNAAGQRTFDLSDVPAEMLKNAPVATQQYVNVNETIQAPQYQNGQKMITLSEADLDAKIQKCLLEFMTTTFTKTLTEATIKKTITTLIKEGKLKVTQKKKV